MTQRFETNHYIMKQIIDHAIYTETFDTEGQLRQALKMGSKFSIKLADHNGTNAGIMYLTRTIEDARLVFKKYRDFYSMGEVSEHLSLDPNDVKVLFSGWLWVNHCPEHDPKLLKTFLKINLAILK